MAAAALRIAAHTLATPDADVLEALRLFADLGVDGVEFVQDNDYPCGIPERPSPSTLAEIRSALDSYGLVAALVTPYVRELDSLDASRHRAAADDLTAAVDTAAALGALGVRVLAGRTAQPQLEARTAQFLNGLRRVAEHAEHAGVRLAIETKGWSMAHDLPSSLRLVHESGAASAGLLYDPANMFMDGDDPLDGLGGPALPLVHVHVKDLQRKPNGTYEPTVLGRGIVPWRSIVARLKDLAFEAFLSLEYERRWHPRLLPPADAGLAEELAVLRDLMT